MPPAVTAAVGARAVAGEMTVEEPGDGGECPDPRRDLLEIPVPHVQQGHNWDCGLACLRMCLRYYVSSPAGGEDAELPEPVEPVEAACLALGLGKSVWTIDVAYLLRRYGVRCRLCTLTLGVDKGYRHQHYYRAALGQDELRVNLLFRRAHENGVVVHKRSVELDEILKHLSEGHVLIVLVNCKLLRCSRCQRNRCADCGSCVVTQLIMPHSYYGHFIVLCGYDLPNKMLLYRNPTCTERVCCITYDSFEECRHSYGTDDDIIFVYGVS